MSSVHDMAAAQKTFNGFVALIKYAIPVIAVIVLVVLLLIAG